MADTIEVGRSTQTIIIPADARLPGDLTIPADARGIVAAAERPETVRAVVSRGGRPDLAGSALP